MYTLQSGQTSDCINSQVKSSHHDIISKFLRGPYVLDLFKVMDDKMTCLMVIVLQQKRTPSVHNKDYFLGLGSYTEMKSSSFSKLVKS